MNPESRATSKATRPCSSICAKPPNRDMTKAFIFVLGGIFVVLLLLLRALVAPIYLILTILLSYAGTLGVMRLVFVDIMGTGGVTWWVPMFMFVMLVALGMDYNIFLIGRVKEEVATSGTRDGTRHALARTGGIITSAGIIMAGTFASMMSGSILGLLQIGFAVAFGVLLDTFVVRTTLVPAIIVLLGRWSWWPRRGPAGHKPVDPVELPPSAKSPRSPSRRPGSRAHARSSQHERQNHRPRLQLDGSLSPGGSAARMSMPNPSGRLVVRLPTVVVPPSHATAMNVTCVLDR